MHVKTYLHIQAAQRSPYQAAATSAFPEEFYNPGTLEFASQPVQ